MAYGLYTAEVEMRCCGGLGGLQQPRQSKHENLADQTKNITRVHSAMSVYAVSRVCIPKQLSYQKCALGEKYLMPEK